MLTLTGKMISSARNLCHRRPKGVALRKSLQMLGARFARKCRGNVMEMSWKCHGNVVEMSWKCRGNVMEMSWKCRGNVMEMSWKLSWCRLFFTVVYDMILYISNKTIVK